MYKIMQVGEEVERALSKFVAPKVGIRYATCDCIETSCSMCLFSVELLLYWLAISKYVYTV